MADRPPTPSDPGTAFLLGKIEGQQREMIHTMNNEAQKNVAISEKLAKLEGVPEQLNKIDQRLTKLEASENRCEGSNGVWMAILKSPALGWLIGAGVTAWAILTGKVTG